MKFLKKLVEFFRRAKAVAADVELKVSKFLKEHKTQIRLLMNLLDAIYPAKTGIKKMACVVETVCRALGLDEYSEDVRQFVEEQCQKIFDELTKEK